MPLVLRWRRWIRSGGGHGSIPGVSYLSGNITPGYSFAQPPLKGPRRQERIDFLLTGGCCWLSSNTTSSSCPCSGFWSPPSAPWFLQYDFFRTGTLHPGGHTHRVSPSSDPSFCPCSGCLTCDCQFFQQLADRILPNRSRISFLFTGQPVEGVPVQVHGSGPVCTGRVVLYSSGMGTVPVFGTVRSCMNAPGGLVRRIL